jgi:hypothetical protein
MSLSSLSRVTAYRMGVAETIALAGVGLATATLASSAVKALWSISRGLGSFEGRILEMLAQHKTTLNDHEDRLRKGQL